MRKSIYFKDEDYRLSFLYGNYVTLTRVTRKDLERIVEQRLSPLYVSLHAVEPEIRKRLLGIQHDDHLIEKIAFLVDHGIELHGQVVLCPGINEGEVLRKTLKTSAQFYPKFRSVAIVPVGLTRHRQHLPLIHGYDAGSAAGIVESVTQFQNHYEKKLGEPFVYLADEFYLLSGSTLPPLSHYREIWQADNGVGMTRAFLSDFEMASRSFPKRVEHPKKVVVATGIIAEPLFTERVAPVLNRIQNLSVEVEAVTNRFYGNSVTVSGLITGEDIIEHFKRQEEEFLLVLPPNCTNEDGLFLDDVTLQELREDLKREVLVLEGFEDLWEKR